MMPCDRADGVDKDRRNKQESCKYEQNYAAENYFSVYSEYIEFNSQW